MGAEVRLMWVTAAAQNDRIEDTSGHIQARRKIPNCNKISKVAFLCRNFSQMCYRRGCMACASQARRVFASSCYWYSTLSFDMGLPMTSLMVFIL